MKRAIDFPVIAGSSQSLLTSASAGIWARLVSNQRPLACEASALPLSYAPGEGILRGSGAVAVGAVTGRSSSSRIERWSIKLGIEVENFKYRVSCGSRLDRPEGLKERKAVNRSIGTHVRRRAAAVVGSSAAMLLVVAGSALAAVYPAGGSGFNGGAQGWQVTDASCNAGPLCTASGGYDGGNGNPPGSIAANTTVALNLATAFKSNVTLQSPDFTVEGGRLGTLHLDRQFAPGSLVDLAAETSYAVTLIDRTAESRSTPLEETIDKASGFVGKDAAVTLVPGHVYAISIAVETSSSVVGTGLLGGTTSTRFDNVELSM